MASRRGESVGSPSGGTAIGKVGKLKAEGRQSRLVTEGKSGEKRVTFKVESDKREEEGQELKMEILTEVRKEIRKKLKEIEERLNKRMEELSEAIKVGNEYIEVARGSRDRDWEKKWEEMKERLKEVEKELMEKVMASLEDKGRESEVSVSIEGSRGRSRNEKGEGLSREGSRQGSIGTIWSEDRLSNKEVEKVRKWVTEREREERKDNIVVRGVIMPEEIVGERKKRQEWVKDLLKDKLGVDCIVGEVRKSGPVLVAKIEGEEGKKEIMRNKYKLKGDKLFIENDLSFEDRKVQEKLSRWARGEKE